MKRLFFDKISSEDVELLASLNIKFLLIFLNINNIIIPIAYSTPAKPNMNTLKDNKFISSLIEP